MLCPEVIATSITAAAIAISKNFNAYDTAILAAAFSQLGDTLSTLAAVNDKIEFCAQKKEALDFASRSFSEE